MPRLGEIFAKRDDNGDIIPDEYVDGYVPITDDERTKLNQIPCVIVGYDFFQDHPYGMDNTDIGLKRTEFFNPQTLKRNHFLHCWGVVSTSPFENAVVFTVDVPAVTDVTVSPSSASMSKGQSLDLVATVKTTGFANKAVTWSVDTTSYAAGVRISESGKLTVPATATISAAITVTATSVYDKTKKGTASITVA